MSTLNRLTVLPEPDTEDRPFFAVFVSIGSESRCINFASKSFTASERTAYIYEKDPGARFPEHRSAIGKLGFSELPSESADLRSYVKELLARCSKQGDGRRRLAVDVSSMTRELMAIWTYALLDSPVEREVEVEFIYSHANFSPPPSKVPLAKSLSSITPEFAGMFADSTAPIMLILGLGYEPQLALSFVEYLEPAKLLVFEPAHHDRKYTAAIREKNDVFFRVIRDAPVKRYNVFSPYTLFQDVESAIQGASIDHRVHIAPYGVKLFAICSLIAAALHYPRIFVWNLKSIPLDNDHDRVASGVISRLVVNVAPRT